MNRQLQVIAGLDRVIHEPGRLMIVARLAGLDECDFGFMLRQTGMSKGNLSSHLARLEKAGYIEIEKTWRGKIPLTLLRLTTAGQDAFEKYLNDLDSLKRGDTS